MIWASLKARKQANRRVIVRSKALLQPLPTAMLSASSAMQDALPNVGLCAREQLSHQGSRSNMHP